MTTIPHFTELTDEIEREYSYRYYERLGLLAGAGPVTPEIDAMARAEADAWKKEALERRRIVFVDELFTAKSSQSQAALTGSRHGHQWCHMWSEDLKALHAMALRIGLKREWFQDKKDFPHYDLVPPKRAAAVRCGAVEVSLADYLRARKHV